MRINRSECSGGGSGRRCEPGRLRRWPHGVRHRLPGRFEWHRLLATSLPLLAACGASADALLPAAPWPPRTAVLNEIRVDQPGTDNDEYVEILVPRGASLDGLTIVVLGDGVGLSGCIEEIIHLDGLNAPGEAGVLLVAQPQMTLAAPDLVMPLEFENSDNLTFVLVAGFHGHLGQDLDLDDDGCLDLLPWSSVLDAVSLVESVESPPVGTEWWYADPVGPGASGDPPFAIRRCPGDGSWQVLPNDPLLGVALGRETPGAPNSECGPWLRCPADLNGDGVVDDADLSILLLSWGSAPNEGLGADWGSQQAGLSPRAAGTVAAAECGAGLDGLAGGAGEWEQVWNPLADLDADGVVGPIDLAFLLASWLECGMGQGVLGPRGRAGQERQAIADRKPRSIPGGPRQALEPTSLAQLVGDVPGVAGRPAAWAGSGSWRH